MTDEEVNSVEAIRLGDGTIRIGVECAVERNESVRSGNRESVRGLAKGPGLVLTNFLGVFTEDGISDSVRRKDLAAARLVTADEVGGFVFVPSEVVPSGTADALTQVHDQSVLTRSFPFELDQGAGLGEEVIIEIVKCFCVDGGHAHSRDELTELVHNAVGSTLTDGHGAGIVGRGVAGDAVEHVRGNCLLATAEAIGHSATKPRDAVASARGVVDLGIECVNVKIHIVGEIVIYSHPIPVLVLTLQDPVEGDLSLGSQVARVAKEQLVQLGPTNIGVAVIIIRVVRVDENPVAQSMIQRQQAIRRHLRNTLYGVGLQVLDDEPAILRLRTEAQKPQQNAQKAN